MTSSLISFQDESEKLLRLIAFFGELMTHIDKARVAAAKHFAKWETGEKREEAEQTLKSPHLIRDTMQQHHEDLLTQLMIQRAVDNFLVYFADLLKELFTIRPESLRSSETVKLEDALSFPTMDELVTYLAERKVDRLAYQSLDDLALDIERTLGFRLFVDPDVHTRAVRLVAIRNLIAHNRCLVNAKFLRQVPECTTEIGEYLEIGGVIDALGEIDFLVKTAKEIDGRAAVHFKL